MHKYCHLYNVTQARAIHQGGISSKSRPFRWKKKKKYAFPKDEEMQQKKKIRKLLSLHNDRGNWILALLQRFDGSKKKKSILPNVIHLVIDSFFFTFYLALSFFRSFILRILLCNLELRVYNRFG